MSESCQICEGRGWIAIEVPHMETVSHEMAMDAQDMSLEGTQVFWGSDWEQQQCQECNGTGLKP